MDPLTLLHQLLDLEVLNITPGKHAQQFSLPATRLALEVIEALHATNQPGSLGRRDTAVRDNLAMHQNQALVIRQIQIMRDSRVRLRKGAVHLISTEVGKDHSRGVVIGRVAGRNSRFLGRWVESPLQEMDVRHRLVLSLCGLLLWCLALARLSREGEDELRVVSCGFGNALVGV